MATGNATTVCGYVIAKDQSFCAMGFSVNNPTAKAQMKAMAKAVRIGNFVVNGNEALVTTIVQCPAGSSGCTSNSNPNAGLPTSSVPFSRAFANAINPAQKHTAIPLTLVNGKWYIEL
ncbi:MAG: hypothetical protein M1483_04105 [Actinobacteria bacterium]|nr:hypothetical protein [Actinomycetota bacterium]MCL6104802.1 hypothetical protein [Actinomycetota bacterium]